MTNSKTWHDSCIFYAQQVIYKDRDNYVVPSFQARRRSTNVFAGKQGFITLRDLFRWAERYSKTPDVQGGGFHDWDQHLAEDGKYLSFNTIINNISTL